ncbi:desmoglein-3 [Onychomys torridus]|uniref:desmoglein-3 n=1 Tax=Onychomys torridus TaxID=38674 RepID=UPI00167F283F|nr:desmoglein-3 [Onychomys torridus]
MEFGSICCLQVLLLVHGELHIEPGGQPSEDRTAVQQAKKRYKREWVKFAKPCREREDNSRRNPIAKITSDFQATQKITYRISGVGIDQPPFGIFVVDPNNGDINITAIVDREETPSFLITCRALNALGQDVERPLILTVKILDVNDNAPVFSQTIFNGEIEENSAPNSLIMILNATDADEPNHMNSKIAFKIISQEPAGMPMFLISRNTGEVRTLTSSLDREQISSYRLVVSGADNDGAGLSSQCECSIKVKDVNDNFPVLRDSQYSARIEENTLNSELLRFQVTDWDEEYTDNWLAVYFFTSGNEGNWFEIETDPRTNEGILKVVKALDYEQMQSMQFSIAVRNKAEFHQSVISQYQVRPTPVIIQVTNVREGISFRPPSKIFTVPRGVSTNKLAGYILGTYQATDEDTGKAASSVRYVLGRNDGGLLVIDSKTAEIKFVKNIDRDSTFIVNKTISAEVLAIDENTGKTSTGTVLVEVPSFSENCPSVVLEKEEICSSSPSVLLSVRTLERGRYTGPYTVSLEEQPLKLPVMWNIKTVNATSAHLQAQQQVSPGVYSVPVVVKDNEGRQCDTPEILTLTVCQCDDRNMCRSPIPSREPILYRESSWGLGPAAIGLILLGLLMLLLAPLLLLTCDCGAGPMGGGAATGGFIPVPDGSEGTIHQWGIEGAQPEDKEITSICVPPTTTNGADFMESSEVCTNTYAGGTVAEGASGMEMTTKLGVATGSGAAAALGPCSLGHSGTMRTRHSTGGTLKDYVAAPVNMTFLGSYFSQKSFAYAEEEDEREVNDCLLIYDDEGEDAAPHSPTLSSCSFIADDLDDSFLDSLGPKFKKLAEICLGIDDEAKQEKPGSKDRGSGADVCARSTEVLQSGSSRYQTVPGSVDQSGSQRYQTLPSSLEVPQSGSSRHQTLSGGLEVPQSGSQRYQTLPGSLEVPQSGSSRHQTLSGGLEVPQSGSQRYQTLPGSQVSSVLSPSGSVLPAIAIPDPLQLGNYLLTETHTTSGSFVQPAAATVDPHLTQNVTVTERVICPLPGVSGSIVAPTELRGSYSMLYTKETCSHL